MTSNERQKLREQVRVAEGFVPRAVCDEVLRGVNPEAFRDGTVAPSADTEGPVAVDKTVRHVLVQDAVPLSVEVNRTLQRIVDELVEPFYQIAVDYWESPDVLAYPPGGFYVPHNDAESVVHDPDRYVWEWQRTFDRDISVVWYLNEDFDGGELVFPPFQLSIRPTTGMVVCFPSTHDFAHTAKPVVRGTRYAVVTWMTAIGTPRVQPVAPAHVPNRAWQ